MSERENGYYWVQWTKGEWQICLWESEERHGKGWMAFFDEGQPFPDECLHLIGPKVEPPSPPIQQIEGGL